jgi:hypothetical protein
MRGSFDGLWEESRYQLYDLPKTPLWEKWTRETLKMRPRTRKVSGGSSENAINNEVTYTPAPHASVPSRAASSIAIRRSLGPNKATSSRAIPAKYEPSSATPSSERATPRVIPRRAASTRAPASPTLAGGTLVADDNDVKKPSGSITHLDLHNQAQFAPSRAGRDEDEISDDGVVQVVAPTSIIRKVTTNRKRKLLLLMPTPMVKLKSMPAPP